MAEIGHLGIAEVVALHAAVMEHMGFAPAPLVQEGLLESAICRTLWASLYEDDLDLVALAARLAVGISQAQAFLDGNKRTAYAATDVFLRLNGARYGGDPLEMAGRLEAVANSQGTRDHAERDFATWLRALFQPLP